MLLVNFVGNKVNSKQLLQTIKNYQVKKVLIVTINEKIQSSNYSTECTDSNVLVLDNHEDAKSYLFKFLRSLKIDFETVEISSAITNTTFIALLAVKISTMDQQAIIDISNCPKSFIPLVLQTGYYIPKIIQEVILFLDDSSLTRIAYPLIAFDFDPDKETLLLKEILALFLTKQKNYSDLAFNKTLSSTLILQLLNDEQTKNGVKELKYPYIQACLNQLSFESKGKIKYLQKRHNSSDKRALLYTITDQGVLTLLIWFLQQVSNESEIKPLYQKLKMIFEDIVFSDIEQSYDSNTQTCLLCGKQHLTELYTCSLCGQESCKECLDEHFFSNKCQPQLQLA